MFGRYWGFLFGLLLTLYAPSVTAADSVSQECLEEAQKIPLVTLRYNYGNLGFDNTKSMQQIARSCGGNAAGCFHHNFGQYTVQTSDKTVTTSSGQCVIPQIMADFVFSGIRIDITREYNSCKARSVMRHELQHFMIWKTAVEEMFGELKVELRNLALSKLRECKKGEYCSSHMRGEAFDKTEAIVKKWSDIAELNNSRLDEVDHNDKTDFNYKACQHDIPDLEQISAPKSINKKR